MLAIQLIMPKKKFFFAFWLLCLNLFAFGQFKITFVTGHIPPLKTGADTLFLAGNFNGWNPASKEWRMQLTDHGQYRLVQYLPPGKYSFKLTRGSWQTVECTRDGKAIADHDFTMSKDTTITVNAEGWQDNFKAAEAVSTASKQVHIVSEKFNMPQLGRERRVWIYLPADYSHSHRKYPVIYMHDGQNLFDNRTAGFGEWGIDEFMDKLPPKDQCIIVGIDHGGDYRITEYDPYDSKYGKGRGDDYVEFLVKTLKPYIDKHYRTMPGTTHTGIAGSSMGGLISMYAELKYPNVFGSAGIFSPAFWIAPPIYNYAQQQKLAGRSRFYFVCGDAESEDMVTDMQKMVNLVRSKDVSEANSPTVVVPAAKHNEKQWHDDFPAFYQWFIQKALSR